MIGLLTELERWHRAGLKVAIARIVDIEGSAPRLAGATMAITEEGEVAGSLSGGCVESIVVEAALDLLLASSTGRLVRFDAIEDPDDPLGVGLTCGGIVDVFIQPLDASLLPTLIGARDGEESFAIVTLIDGDSSGQSIAVRATDELIDQIDEVALDAVVVAKVKDALQAGESRLLRESDDVVVFVHSFPAPPHLVVIGAVDFTAALVRVGRLLGYRVTVCDARATFATATRFPEANEVIVDWPHRYLETISSSLGPNDAICVLTHDHKYDVPALMKALGTNVGYIGAMGSRNTHLERKLRLLDAGASDRSLERIMAPIGLDIGANTPEEVAVATCAEIIAARHGRIGAPVLALRDGDGPIHRLIS